MDVHVSISVAAFPFSRNKKTKEEDEGVWKDGRKEVKIERQTSRRKKIGRSKLVHVPENCPPCRPPPPPLHICSQQHEISSVALLKLSCERTMCTYACTYICVESRQTHISSSSSP